MACWVTPGTPSKRFSIRTPCQWIVVGISMSFVTRTITVASFGAWISGPGYWPL